MKIAIVGCGALGSFYGAKLAREGQEVHFLLRYDYETVRRQGVSIRSPDGDFNARPRCGNTPEIIGVADLVLIGLKTTANDQFARLLPPLVGPRTAILTLQNGLGNEERLARLFSVEQIMGGLCFVCLNRLEPGLIQHLAHGHVVLGEFRRRPGPRTHRLAGLFVQGGVPCSVTEELERAHWEKLTWNIPFNGLGVAGAAGYDTLAAPHSTLDPSSVAALRRVDIRHLLGPCLTTDMLLADARWEQLVRELMQEVIAIARALGFELPYSFADEQIARTRPMGAYRASTLIDFGRGQPLEIRSLFLEPLRQAQKVGVPVPRLEALCGVLRELDPGARAGAG